MSHPNDIVITGMGMVTSIGIGVDSFWDSLLQGKSGVRRRNLFPGEDWGYELGSEVLDFEPKKYVKPRKSLKVMCRPIQMGFSAAALAMEQAGIAKGDIPADRMGVVFGSELFYCDIQEVEDTYRGCIVDGEFNYDLWFTRVSRDLFPLWMLKHLPNMAASHICIAFDARGPNNTITLGEASSALAWMECVDVIRRGGADMMLAGGAGSRVSLAPMVFRGQEGLSRNVEHPQGACRPFEANRDGAVIGEGAGCCTLETRHSAQQRGAEILATHVGGARTIKLEQESLQAGIERSMTLALRNAKMHPEDIGFVVANGLGAVEEDRHEAQAIRAVLGDTPVTAPKSMVGQLGAAASSIDIAVGVLALKHGKIPPTLNYAEPAPECPINVVHGEPRDSTKNACMVLSQSYTGQTTAIILCK